MNENLNLVEILKDCPEGTEFYSSIYGNVKFKRINKEDIKHPIEFYTLNDYHDATADGRHLYMFDGECTFFPSKDQRDWSKWQRPFVDGDIIFYNDIIAIFKEWGDETLLRTYVTKYLCCDSLIDINTPLFGKSIRKEIRFATEKEKEQLFQAIKDHGYKWNNKTKTLEKLIVPKFKVGDKIRLKENHNYIYTITDIKEKENKYTCGVTFVLRFSEQDNWELFPNKFDITTLKPFDKVLVRQYNEHWHIQFFETIHKYNKKYPFMCLGGKIYSFCIPYIGNEHLLDTMNEPSEFYRYWEN